MPPARMHFWVSAARRKGAFSSPRKYGTNWFMPAFVNRRFGDDGISDADLADFMYDRFEGICAGSTELLTSQCEGLITSLAGGSNGDFEVMPENQEDETE